MTPLMKIAADAYAAKELANDAFWDAMDILEDSLQHAALGDVVAVPQHCLYPSSRGCYATITGMRLNYDPEYGFYWRMVADTQLDPESSDRNYVQWTEYVRVEDEQ